MGKTLLPPGFRFHPTDIELIKYYLKRKVMGKKLCLDVISEVDIYTHSPWDLPDKSYLRTGDLKWYFFCPVEKKYGRGARCNRSTECGYWKATGKDRLVLYNQVVAGMIKTLVFHKGKAPKGERTNWVMHEYRLEDGDLAKEGVVQDMYVLCVLFQKDGLGPRNGAQYGAPFREMDWSEDEGNCDVSVSLTSLSTPTFADAVGPSGSVATTSCAPKCLLYTPTTVEPNGSVATTSCAPKSLSYSLYTPTSLHPIDQDGSDAATFFHEILLFTSADPIKQVGSIAATKFVPENLLSVMPSSYEVSPRALDVPMHQEASQILSEDDIQAMMEMFSEDNRSEEMFQGPTNTFDAIPSPSMPSHYSHINSLVTGSCSGVANTRVPSLTTHVPLPSAALNVPLMTRGANNGFTLMNDAPSSQVEGEDDIESLLAIFTEDS